MMMAFFVVARHSNVCLDLHTITEPTVLIGRAAECAIRLQDARVSRIHAQLRCADSHLEVSNLSKGGCVSVHGLRVATARLNDGDEFEVRPFQLRVFFNYDVAKQYHASEDDTPLMIPVLSRDVEECELALTPTEREILRDLLSGMNELEIAKERHRNYGTIHTHVKAIYKAFRVKSRGKLMALYGGEQRLGVDD